MPVRDVFDEVAESPSRDMFDEISVEESISPPEREELITRPIIATQPEPDWAAIEAEYNRKLYSPLPKTTLVETLKEGLSEGMSTAAESPIGLPAKALSFVPRPTAQQVQDAVDLVTNPLDPAAPSQPPSEAVKAITGAVNVGRDVGEGLVSPIGVATLGAGALPSAAQRLMGLGFVGDMAMHVGDQAARAGEAIVTGDTQEKVEAFGNLAVTPVMAGTIGVHSLRPRIPEPVRQAIVKADEVGLTKSAQALADTVKKTEVENVAQKQTEASAQPTPVDAARVDAVPENVPATRAQEVIRFIVELPDAEAGTLKQKPAVEAGMKLTAEEVPALEKARDAAGAEMLKALESGDEIKFRSEYGRNIWFSGAIEGANRKGPNFDALLQEKAAAPVKTEPALEPVLESQALDLQSGAPIVPSPPVPPTTGVPAAPELPAGDLKMRKSAQRATTSPDIPAPVQEVIKTAPESFYEPQSMKRVEEAVSAMPEEALSTVSKDSELYTAAKLEQAKRRFDAGDNDGGYQVFVELEKEGTRMGQLINQFKLLAGSRPEQIVAVMNKTLESKGRDVLTPEQTTQAIEVSKKSKDADVVLDAATKEWQKNPTPENAAKAEVALDGANVEAVELQKFVARFEPKSTSSVLKSVLQGNLLTPISEVANLFGNMSFLPFRAGTRAIASTLDIIDSAIRKKPRELAVQPIAGTMEAASGVARGVAQIPKIFKEGTGSVIKGETRAGLHPIQAWINQFSRNPEMPTTGGRITLKDRLNLAIEGTLGVPAEAMLRGLGAGDMPFKEAAKARVTAEQLKLNNVPREQWDFAQKFPELFLPKKSLAQIQKDTLAAVFQGESKTLNLMTSWLKGKGEVLDLLVATIAPYKLTPWNIIGEILSYNPLVAMAKGVRDVAKSDSRAAKLNAGKMVVGSMLTATGTWLYQKGLLAPSLDERDEAQKARMLSGKVLPPNHINISGLKRAMDGDDATFKAGDETVDVFRAGGLAGAMFYMTANIGRDMERGPEVTDSDMWMSILRQSTLEQARFGLNQSFLSGIEGLLTAIKEGNGDNFLRQWANTVGSIVLPNTLNTLSRASREYQPDLKAEGFKGKIENMARSKLGIAGLDDYLPLKRDFWGKPMLETPEGRNAIFYHFFDISKNKQVTSDPVELELYRLWRKTGDSAVIPSIPQRTVTFEKTSYALTPEQYDTFSEMVGTRRREIVDALVVNPNFYQLNDEEKMDMLERVYRDGMTQAKMEFYLQEQGKLTAKQGRAGFP